MQILFTLFYVLFGCFYSIDSFRTLPSFIKPCNRSNENFNECLIKHGNEAIPAIIKGDPMYHIPSFDPFKINKVSLDASDSIKLFATDIRIIGINLIELKDMNWNFDKQEINVKLFTPLLRILGTYNMDGRILILNFKGSGAMNNSHNDIDIIINATYSLYQKEDNKDYFHFENIDLNFIFKTTALHFDNLLNNPVLSNQINEILNDNAHIFIKEIFGSIKDIILSVALKIMKPFADEIPFDEIVIP